MNEALAHTDNSAGAGEREDARRSAPLVTRAVGGIRRVGDNAGGLRSGSTPEHPPAKAPRQRRKRGEREESEYLLETVKKALKVLEALEGRAFEPATISRVAKRTGFSQSFCRSALLTFKHAGYAKQTFDGFIVGPKLARFASRITAAHSAMAE